MARTKTKARELRLADPTDIWRNYDADKALAGLKSLVGLWADMDTEKLAADIKRWRKEGSRK